MSMREAINGSISRGKLVSAGTSGVKSTSIVPSFANPMWIELAVLSKRSIINSRRKPEQFAIRLCSVMVTGFILATVFWQLDRSPQGVRERLGFIAFGMATTLFSCTSTLPVFLQERYILVRETAHNAYRRSSYVLSRLLTELPDLIVLSIAFASVTFWAVGLDGGISGFFFYFAVILASFCTGSSFVTFLSGIVNQLIIGYIVVVAILAYFLLFSGFFINRERIPPYWIWFHYASLLKYPFEAVMQNEFKVDGTKCYVTAIQDFDSTPLAQASNEMKVELLKSMGNAMGINISSSTCVVTASDILRTQGITDISKWNCLLITVAWGLFFRILFYFTLTLSSKNKRR